MNPSDKKTFESAANRLLQAFKQRGTLSNHEMRDIAGTDYRRRMHDLMDKGWNIVHLEDRTERITSPETGHTIIRHYYQFKGRKVIVDGGQMTFGDMTKKLPTQDDFSH